MYTLTVIRLSLLELKLENTEFSGFCFNSIDIEKRLSKHNASFEQVERVLNLKIRESITIEIQNENKVWFYYINKF